MKTRFLYHADAVAATGHVTLPFSETMEIQAAVALPINGGHGSSRVERFRHRDIFSFERAESHVVGSFSEKDNAHGTLASVIVEGLNILNVVTCERIIVRITSKHPEDGEPSIIPLGSRFQGLKIAGHRIEVDLATDLFTQLSTWTGLSDAYAKDKKIRAQIDSLALYPKESGGFERKRGTFGCTLARNLDHLPGGLTRKDHGIYVPHFGTVYLGEFFISAGARRLLMLNVELGCSVEGGYGVGSGSGNGDIWP